MDYPIAENLRRNPKVKPKAKLAGVNGNVYNLIAICKRALHSMPNAYNDMWERIQVCGSYEEALGIMQDYVEVE